MSHVRYRVHHLTRYFYSAPAWDAFGKLHLEPLSDRYQRILEYRLNLEPLCTLEPYTDAFENYAHDYHMPEAHLTLNFTSEFEAEINTASRVPSGGSEAALLTLSDLKALSGRYSEFLMPTQLTPRAPLHGPGWSELLEFRPPLSDESLLYYLLEFNRHLFKFFKYTPGSTGVDTTALEATAQRRGVCQDYTHTALAFLRSCGIPVRYVSGYLYVGRGSSLVGNAASHAWLEVFLPYHGWLGLDPTNGVYVSETHISIAVGRDYKDIAPVTGTRHGGGKGSLEVKVKVEKLEEKDSPPAGS